MKITKPYCRGTARRHHLAERATHFEAGGVYGALTQQRYTAFAEIEDLYLFASGQAAFTGLITNLAYRRNASEPFHRVIESLKGFQDFQQLVRELHVRERLPVVMNTLEADGSMTFRYVPTGQVWRKRNRGGFPECGHPDNCSDTRLTGS